MVKLRLLYRKIKLPALLMIFAVLLIYTRLLKASPAPKVGPGLSSEDAVPMAESVSHPGAFIYERLYPWALEVLNKSLASGQALSEDQRRQALEAGVQHPEKIRLMILNEIPSPDPALLKKMFNDKEAFNLETFTQDTRGLTLGYTVCLRSEHGNDQSLIAHEFVHVAQQERLGGFENFLKAYIGELYRFGYWQAPLEQEAFAREDQFKHSQKPDF